jgi:hypothetical protein
VAAEKAKSGSAVVIATGAKVGENVANKVRAFCSVQSYCDTVSLIVYIQGESLLSCTVIL